VSKIPKEGRPSLTSESVRAGTILPPMKYLHEHIQAELGDDGLRFTVPLAKQRLLRK